MSYCTEKLSLQRGIEIAVSFPPRASSLRRSLSRLLIQMSRFIKLYWELEEFSHKLRRQQHWQGRLEDPWRGNHGQKLSRRPLPRRREPHSSRSSEPSTVHTAAGSWQPPVDKCSSIRRRLPCRPLWSRDKTRERQAKLVMQTQNLWGRPM